MSWLSREPAAIGGAVVVLVSVGTGLLLPTESAVAVTGAVGTIVTVWVRSQVRPNNGTE